MDQQDIFDKIKENDFKITQQRRVIIEVLLTCKNTLVSVDKIYTKSQQIYSKTNISTVYRNLEMLEKIDLVHKIITENGASLYQLNCNNTHHHHIICKGCGKTEIINYCPISHLKDLTIQKSFKLTDHKLELYGYCKNCDE